MKFEKDLRSLYSKKYNTDERSPVWVNCPFHHEDTPSFAVYTDHAYCYGCRTWEGYHDHLRRVGEEPPLAAGETTATFREEISQHTLQTLVALYHKRLFKEGKETYLIERGISRAVISQQQLGYCGFAYSIPIFGSGDEFLPISTIRFRKDPAANSSFKGKYWGLKDANSDVPLYLGIKSSMPVVWCEGELDALLLHSLGYSSLTLTNGIGAVEREEVYLGVLSTFRSTNISCVLVGVDNDPASYRKGLQLVKRLRDDGFIAQRLEFDEKDLGEVWKKDNNAIHKLLGGYFATCRSYCRSRMCALREDTSHEAGTRDSECDVRGGIPTRGHSHDGVDYLPVQGEYAKET
jgi:hypothetical protein